jgi:hypothetical protein
MAETLGRRKFLLVAAAGITLPALSPAAAAAASDGDGCVGVVAEATTTRLRLETQDGALEVQVGDGARMYSGAFGVIADASEFIVGDRVAVEGRRSGSSLRATAVGSVLYPFSARVVSISRDGSEIQTTEGVVATQHARLPYERSPRSGRAVPRLRVAVGDGVAGFTWQDPRTRGTYLMVPGV